MPLTTKPDITVGEHVIRIKEEDHHNWSYRIYKTGKKWKRVRAIQFYITPEAAERAARTWLSKQQFLAL